jgi:lysophospholipid acyltransferase (LPLAT)-like uncharacterized protein
MLSRQRRRKIRNWMIGLLGPPSLRVWASSLRVRFLSDIELENARVVIPNCIALVWHQRLFTLAGSFPNSGFSALISQHADGEMLARVFSGLGLNPIRGSSTRGGAKAVLELMKAADSSVRIAITPDGPRGPARRLQQGAIFLASRTGLPIYTVAVGLAKAWKLRSWDEFLIPKPFTRALLRTGGPFHVPADLDRDGIEAERLKIEAQMQEMTEDTDARFEELYATAARFRGFVRRP